MWEHFTLERAEVRKILAEVPREKQEGIQGQWQQESPFREVWNKSREVRMQTVVLKGCVDVTLR